MPRTKISCSVHIFTEMDRQTGCDWLVLGTMHISYIQHDVIKWKHFPRYWPFVRGIHRSPVNSPHKGQWRGALMFSLICAWINCWVNNREAGDLRRYRAHYDVTVMKTSQANTWTCCYIIKVNGIRTRLHSSGQQNAAPYTNMVQLGLGPG